jgi:hypothetical protein
MFCKSFGWKHGWQFTVRSTYWSCWGTPWGLGSAHICASELRKLKFDMTQVRKISRRSFEFWIVYECIFLTEYCRKLSMKVKVLVAFKFRWPDWKIGFTENSETNIKIPGGRDRLISRGFHRHSVSILEGNRSVYRLLGILKLLGGAMGCWG